MSHQIDNLDLQILRHLQENSILTHKELGKLLGRSASSVFDRIKKLKQNGIILGYTILVDHEKIGILMLFHIHIRLKEHTFHVLQDFEDTICALTEVVECANVTGKYDYVLKVCVPDMKSYHDFLLFKLGQLPNISDIRSVTVISEPKQMGGYLIGNVKLGR